MINKETGLIEGIRLLHSPNCDQRPANTGIDCLVIHCISLPPKEYGNDFIDQLFTNTLEPASHPYFQEIAHLKVSAHALIRRDGTITQYVPFTKRAWHAGESEFKGRSNCNDFSAGIELEGSDDDHFTNAQYSQLVRLTISLIQCWPGITLDRIVGHSEIAPGRKTDPGEFFDWQRYGQLLTGE